MRLIVKDNIGATAVEFALVAPVFFVMIIGAIVYGIALWNQNVIDDVATEAARCIAVGNDACMFTVSGCANGPAICHILRLAQDRGLSGLSARDITIEQSAVIGTATFTRVTITYSFDISGYEMALSANGSFPNN